MRHRVMQRGLMLLFLAAGILTLAAAAFADSTNYTYDDVNRVIRVQSGTLAITATASSHGTLSPSGKVVVSYGASQSFTITPDYGYHIDDIKIDGKSITTFNPTGDTYTFTDIRTAHAIDVKFVINTYPLNVTLTTAAGGSVISDPAGISCDGDCSEIYTHGTTVTLTATPESIYDFLGWSGACTGTGSCTVSMTGAKNVTAIFGLKTYTIAATVSGIGGGQITPWGTTMVAYGGSQAYTIGSSLGFTLNDVVVDGLSKGAVPTYTFNDVRENHTITASFSCQNLPVRIAGATPRYFSTLQNAYNAASDGETIQSQAVALTENLNVNRNISVTLEGGYTCDYATNAGNTTSMKGQLQTFLGGGTLMIKNFILVSNMALPATRALPPGDTYYGTVAVTLACASGADCAAIYYTIDGTTPTTASNIYTGSITISATTTLKFFAVNRVGVAEAVQSQTYTMDGTAPSGTVVINGGAAATNDRSVTLTLTCSDSGGSCAKMRFSNDSTNWSDPEPFVETKTWQLAADDGTKTVYAKFRDAVGNWSATANDAILLDTAAPVTAATPAGGLYNAAQSVSLACSDSAGGSGCVQIHYTTDGSTPTTASPLYAGPIGIGTTAALKYFARDAAGNTEAVQTQTYTIDMIPPAGTVTINGGVAFTNAASVTLTLTCTDDNGCAQMQFSNDNTNWSTAEAFAATKSWALAAGDGTKTVYARYKDNAGNWSPSPSSYSASIGLDTTAPSTGATPAGGTFATAQTVTLTCSDGSGSGCGTIYYTIDGSTPTTASAVYAVPIPVSVTTTIKYFATDLVANAGAVSSQTYNINFIRIAGGTPRYFESLQATYDAAVEGDVIQVQATTLAGSLTVNRNISVRLEGGYDNTFTTYTGPTTLRGMIQTTAGGGTLTIKNFILTQ